MIDDSDDDVRLLLEEEINELKVKIDKLEIETYLNGKYDKNAAIMEIHAGAGGTESCDWAQMLYRMYSRYAERMDIVLLYLIGKMVKRQVLNLLCFKLMVPLLMAI